MSFEEIMAMYHEGNKELAGEFAVEEMEGYIKSLMKTKFSSYSKYYEDLYQEGLKGLFEALPTYDPTKAKPTTYFHRFVVHNMFEYITTFVSQSTAHYQKFAKMIRDVEKRYEMQGRPCSDADICIETGVNMETIIKTRKTDGKVINHIESSEADFYSETQEEKSAEELFLEKERSRELKRVVGSLNVTEQSVIRCLFFEELSQRETSENLNMTIEEVRKIKEKALRKMRNRMDYEVPHKESGIERIEVVNPQFSFDTIELLAEL